MTRDTAVNLTAITVACGSGLIVAFGRPDLGPLSTLLVAWSCGMIAALVTNRVTARWGG